MDTKKMDKEVVKEDLKWWMEDYGFFGEFYMQGDDSIEGYLEGKKQTLSERTISEVDGIIRLLDLKKGNRLMDCPCGYGRHSNELQYRGIDVVGCDINSVHLSKAKENAVKRDLSTDFKQKNMIELDYTGEFDAVINMFYSFGFFDTDEENFKVLKNFYNSLKQGGKFLMHTDVNISRIQSGKYKFDEERILTSGKSLRIIDVYDEETKKIYGKWTILGSDGKTETVDYAVRVYTKEEFTEMCHEAGFTKVTVYSDWEGTPYLEDAEDMIIIAEK
ncbi:SAM-dependent methyltransferase [Enterococcus larvae]|uniref:SAM-dependent methyltransferase n=1 Tax=Enterococcus larvae TaxID=2794352 RepID=UPI003F35126C